MSTYWNFDKPVYENKRYVAEFVKKFEGDCTNYALKGNIENYATITKLPTEFYTADYSGITKAAGFFKDCAKLQTVPENINIDKSTESNEFLRHTSISRIPYVYTRNTTTLQSFLEDCDSLVIAECGKIIVDPKKLTTMYGFLTLSGNLKEIISMPDTSYVRNFGWMLKDCYALEKICKINTDRGQDFNNMFRSIKISGLDWEINLQCATNVEGMFSNCASILDKGITLINVPRTLDLSNIGIATSKYTVKNNIETALDPSEVVD